MSMMTNDEIDDVFEEAYKRALGDCPPDHTERRDVEYYAEHQARYAVAKAMQDRCIAAVRQTEMPEVTPGVAESIKNSLMRSLKQGWYATGSPSFVTDIIHWNGKDHEVKWQCTKGGEKGIEINLFGGRSLVMTIPEWIVLARWAIQDATWSQEVAKLFYVQEVGRAAQAIRGILAGLEETYKGAIERLDAEMAKERAVQNRCFSLEEVEKAYGKPLAHHKRRQLLGLPPSCSRCGVALERHYDFCVSCAREREP